MTALDLPPTTASVPAARRFVSQALHRSAADLDTALLLVSEVVTNAVLHARTPVTVHVVDQGGSARIEVRDGSPVHPRIHAHSSLSATGRGLRLLDQLARTWGVRPEPAGKVVWFEVAGPADADWAAFGLDGCAEGGGS